MLHTSLRVGLLALVLWLAMGGVVAAQELNCWDAEDRAQQAPAKPPPQAPDTPAASAPAPTANSPRDRLTVGQKFTYALYRGFGPGAALSSFAVGGYQQALDKKKGYGQGAEGYFSRVGGSYATFAAKQMVGSFALASIFRQDPRYLPSGRQSRRARLVYALSRVVVTRGDNGRTQFNICAVGGGIGAGLISNAWHEPPDHTFGHGLSRGGMTLGVEALRNVFREFWPDIRRKLGR